MKNRCAACLPPTFNRWGARSPPCVVPGYPSGFVEETGENTPASSSCEEQRAVEGR